MQTTASLVNFQMSIGQQNTSARHLTIGYYEPTYFCGPAKGNFVYFSKRPLDAQNKFVAVDAGVKSRTIPDHM